MNFFHESFFFGGSNHYFVFFPPCDDNFTKNYFGIGQAAILGFKFFRPKIFYFCVCGDDC